MKAILIPVDVTEPIVALDVDGDLGSLQGAVDGQIESCPMPTHLQARKVMGFIDEEGRRKGKGINTRATTLVRSAIFRGDFIAGPLVLVGVDGEGETVECCLSVEEVEAFCAGEVA